MKKIEAIIRPDRFEAVIEGLHKEGINGITVTEVRGHGRQMGYKQQWRGVEYSVDLLPKVKLELVVTEAVMKKAIATIIAEGKTGEIGDGKIFILPIDDVIRVRTGENGEGAI